MTQDSSNLTPRRWQPKDPYDPWVAPEHARMAQDMKRKYPVNDKGERIPGRQKELVIDKRPQVMRQNATDHIKSKHRKNRV